MGLGLGFRLRLGVVEGGEEVGDCGLGWVGGGVVGCVSMALLVMMSLERMGMEAV